MATVLLHEDARADLRAIRQEEPDAADLIEVLLEELDSTPEVIGKLLDHGYGSDHDADFQTKKWQRLWRKGNDIWRLKFWPLQRLGLHYRVIYAYRYNERRFFVLAVAKRADINYDDPSDELAKRILNAYHQL